MVSFEEYSKKFSFETSIMKEIKGNWVDSTSTYSVYQVLRLYTREQKLRDIGSLEYLEYIDVMYNARLINSIPNSTERDNFLKQIIKEKLIPPKEEKGKEHVELLKEIAEVFPKDSNVGISIL